jgi:predicted alpha/beta hydrolase family esterase
MMRQPQAYEHWYLAWAKAKKDYKDFNHDDPPNPKDFGLTDWEAEQIRKRVDRELSRTS